jgi:hypothetical protein
MNKNKLFNSVSISLGLLLITLTSPVLSCKNNCYLGGSFFSAPLDGAKCCREDLKDPNCEYYTQMLNSMICFRCKIGFQWSNNECVKNGTLHEDDGNYFNM